MIYYVKFTGHYPVGAVAIVRAPNRGVARKRFFEHLGKEEPFLVKENMDLTNEDFILLDVVLGPDVQILLNGDY